MKSRWTVSRSPTTYRLTTIERTGEITNRTLYTCLYSSNSEFNPDKYEDYYFWDGDTLTIPELVLVDPENFTSFQTLSITFSYGFFD